MVLVVCLDKEKKKVECKQAILLLYITKYNLHLESNIDLSCDKKKMQRRESETKNETTSYE